MCATGIDARPRHWGRWGALLPLVACAACSLEGLSEAWDAEGGAAASSGGGAPDVLDLEAEGCNLYGNFKQMAHPEASGMTYVVVPEEANCKEDRVDCSFEISRAGTYQIKARVAEGPDQGKDSSFLVRMDHKPPLGHYYDFTGAEFHDDIVSDADATDTALLTFALDPGTHIVSFECREDGAMLDQVGLLWIGP